MEKKIEDYLHLYFNSDVKWREHTYPCFHCFKGLLEGLQSEVKLILRPLSSMTEEYFVSIFKIAIGAFEDAILTSYKQMSTNQLYVSMGYAEYILFYTTGFDNDQRVESGISFHIKSFLIKDKLAVDAIGITESKIHFNDAKDNIIVKNQTVIFNKLRKDNFDCDNLIESNLAITQ